MDKLKQLNKVYYTIPEAVDLINQKFKSNITEDNLLQTARNGKLALFIPISVEYGLFDINLHIHFNNDDVFNALLKMKPLKFDFGCGHAINRHHRIFSKPYFKIDKKNLMVSYRMMVFNGLIAVSLGEINCLGNLKYNDKTEIQIPSYIGKQILCEKLLIDDKDYYDDVDYIIAYILNSKKHNKRDHLLKTPISSLVITRQHLNMLLGGDESNTMILSINTEQTKPREDKKVNIQAWERSLNEVLLKEHYANYLDSSSSTSLANHLNFIAEKHGYNLSFDDSTISRFIKKINSSKKNKTILIES